MESQLVTSQRPAPSYSVSVFFPCYNERDHIEPLVREAAEVLDGISDDYEIILVDDGSRDGTGELADGLAARFPFVRVIHHETNAGYGAALQSGFRAATKELVFYTDGDRQFDLKELPGILPLIESCDIVSCFRLNRREGLLRRINAYGWTKLVCFLFDLKLKDIDCAFKLYRREIFDTLEMNSTGALIDTEILARAARKGCRIVQVGVHHYPRLSGRSTGAKPGVIWKAFCELFQLRKNILRQTE